MTCLKSFIIHPRARQSVFYHHNNDSLLWPVLKICWSTLRHTQPVFHHPPVFQGFDKIKCVLGPTNINILTIYNYLVSLLWHNVNYFFIHSCVKNQPTKQTNSVFFPHLVLAFSTMKWFQSLCVHPSSNIVSIPNQCFSDVTCFKCFLHSLHIKYIQSFKNMQCFSCVTCFKCFSNPLELKHTRDHPVFQCCDMI